MDAKLKTFRIRSVPLGWTISQLRDFLSNNLEEAVVHDLDELYLAREVDGETSTATVQLTTNKTEYELPLPRSESEDGCPRKYLSLDSHFRGWTTLFAPSSSEHHTDIIAVHGLGGHAFGAFSFKSKDHADHMWLRDTLPDYLKMDNIAGPAARILTYGYKSAVLDSQSVQTLAEIGQGLRLSLQALLKNSDRPLILVGYSMGGLVIKEALGGAPGASDPLIKSILAQTSGILFFGCPHDGMEAQSLQLMVQGRPNQALIDSLCSDRSAMLSRLSRDFLAAVHDICAEGDCEVFNFYETTKTPTFVPVGSPSPSEDRADQPRGEVSKRWIKSGDPIYLVKRASASHCRPANHTADNCIAIDRAHYDLVKFARVDEDYERVVAVLKRISTRATRRKREKASKSQTAGEASRSYFVVPYGENERYVPRSAIIQQISSRFGHVLEGLERPARRVALYGLGGAGKTQIMLSYLYWLKRHKPSVSIFWVSGENAERFRESYEDIARKCGIPMSDGSGQDRLELVKEWLMDGEHGEWLLALDNADDRTLFNQARGNENTQLGPRSLMSYLPDCQHGKLLITTRNKDVGRRVVKIPKDNVVLVGPMANEESQLLLTEKLLSANTEDIVKLAETLAGLPLAMAQAAAYIDQLNMSIAGFLDLFNDGDPVALLSRGSDLEDAESRSNYVVSRICVLCFEQIAERSTIAMQTLQFVSQLDRSNIPMDYLRDYVCLLHEIEEKRDQRRMPAARQESATKLALMESVSILQDFSLVFKQKGNLLSMHPLVHIVARRWVQENDQHQESLAHTLFIVGKRLDTWKAHTIAHSFQLLPELPHLMALGSAPIRRENVPLDLLRHMEKSQVRIILSLAQYLADTGRRKDGQAWAEKAVCAAEACLEIDSRLLLIAKLVLSDLLAIEGEFARAAKPLREILAQEEKQLESMGLQEEVLYPLMLCERAMGQSETADTLRQKLLSIQPGRTERDPVKDYAWMIASQNIDLGDSAAQERFESLTRDCIRALDARHCSGEHPGTIGPSFSLGKILLLQKRHAEAESYLRRALTIAQKTHSRWAHEALKSKELLISAVLEQDRYNEAKDMTKELLDDWKSHPNAEYASSKEMIGRLETCLMLLAKICDERTTSSRLHSLE